MADADSIFLMIDRRDDARAARPGSPPYLSTRLFAFSLLESICTTSNLDLGTKR